MKNEKWCACMVGAYGRDEQGHLNSNKFINFLSVKGQTLNNK